MNEKVLNALSLLLQPQASREGFGLPWAGASPGSYLCQYSRSLLITNILLTHSQQFLTRLAGKLRLINPGASPAHAVTDWTAVAVFMYLNELFQKKKIMQKLG